MTNKTYTWQISADGIKRTVGDMFSNRDIYLQEMGQNAQRAGAKTLHFDYFEPEGVLVVTDDGHGFSEESWDAYFLTGESGWDDAVMQEQNPFGIGCASLLFAATEVAIWSGDAIANFSTDELLNGAAVAIRDAGGTTPGAIFALRLKQPPGTTELWRKITRMFDGFPIPVVFNGSPIPRPGAIDAGNFRDVEVGSIYFSPDLDVRDLTGFHGSIYLQGFGIHGVSYRFGTRHSPREAGMWVHLDPKEYRGRVPDRTHLVGADTKELSRLLDQYARDELKSRLRSLRRTMGARAFAERYWEVAASNAPELIADCPFPLSQVYRRTEGKYRRAEWEDASCLAVESVELAGQTLESIDQRQLEALGWTIFADYTLQDISDTEEPEDFTALQAGQFLLAGSCMEVERIPRGHWLADYVVGITAPEEDGAEGERWFTMTAKGSGKKHLITSIGTLNLSVVFCDRIDLTYGVHTVSTEFIQWFDDDATLFIPKHFGEYEELIRQVGFSVLDEDELNQSLLNEYRDSLRLALQLARSGSGEDLLEEVIREGVSAVDSRGGGVCRGQFVVNIREYRRRGYDVVSVDVESVSPHLQAYQQRKGSRSTGRAKARSQRVNAAGAGR